jgi:hypothetical protein
MSTMPSRPAHSLDGNAEETRGGRTDPERGDPGYISGNERLKISLSVTRRLSLWLRGRSDQVAFDSAGTGAFDYSRLGGEVGVSTTVGDYSLLTGSGFILRRSVPDATTEEYRSSGLDVWYAGVLGSGDIDISTHYELRDYAREGSLDDYRR